MKVNKKPKELYKIYTVLKSRVLIHIYTKELFTIIQIYKYKNSTVDQYTGYGKKCIYL